MTKTDSKGGFVYEPGYSAVLVRNETKEQLSRFHNAMKQRDLYRECRIVTAALEIALEDAANDPDAMSRLIDRTKKVVTRDMNNTG